MPTARARTAMSRTELSRPVRVALDHEVIVPGDRVLDFGCGRGADVEGLLERRVKARGWDPAHRPDTRLTRTDKVYLGYVVNVIEDPLERTLVLRKAWDLARDLLIVAARLDFERDDAHIRAYGDGWITSHRTFQKFFAQDELREWIEAALGQPPIAAGPGVFYVFRHSHHRELFLSRRHRLHVAVPHTRKSDKVFEQHRELLAPLVEFVADRGRIPRPDELETSEQIADAFGSIKRAFRVIRWVTDDDEWRRLQERRAIDLLVYLALSLFAGPRRFGDLARPVQYDVRAFYPSFKDADAKAQRLLFAVGNADARNLAMRSSLVGKLTPAALYAHVDALAELPALLRVYEGCGQAFCGTVEDANIIKLSREAAQVSYLRYPAFDTDPHPTLNASLTANLTELKLGYRTYDRSANPPILHRKEAFLGALDRRRPAYAALTAAEEAAGLYEHPARIGTRRGWNEALAARGLTMANGSLQPVGAGRSS